MSLVEVPRYCFPNVLEFQLAILLTILQAIRDKLRHWAHIFRDEDMHICVKNEKDWQSAIKTIDKVDALACLAVRCYVLVYGQNLDNMHGKLKEKLSWTT